VSDGGADPRVQFFGDDMVIVVFQGHVDADSVRELMGVLDQALAEKRVRGAIFDTLAVTSVNGNVTLVGAQFLAVLQKRGCTRSTCASSMAVVRMLGSTIALAAGLRLRFVDTMEAARRELISDLSRESR
jgi:anti-anti-sigma regulatory factor